jgi:hypothetical protein
MRRSVPAELYKNIYLALFESHLTYGISVWGVALKNKANEKLFITQKHSFYRNDILYIFNFPYNLLILILYYLN